MNVRRESGDDGGGGGAKVEIAMAVNENPKLGHFKVYRGYPTPFGATALDGDVNFTIFSTNVVSATLCLISLRFTRREFPFFSFLFLVVNAFFHSNLKLGL